MVVIITSTVIERLFIMAILFVHSRIRPGAAISVPNEPGLTGVAADALRQSSGSIVVEAV
ncbi:hypothetical protein MESS2_1590048 [Mesorhizobium metallidurans STM 2683]|uniref:Uncharacterized protein n=1 Tax=Mesorhizobium metallidurans STM 2683 TaxID=1297569 RepID=M5F140_9HYPH|nr:hypothetical protein MESS2_1590048 [Mesorhizobium metallidurans STM 2683]